MHPEKLHIQQINRLHKIISDLKIKIDNEQDKDKKGELCLQYFYLTELWNKVDEFIEFTLKHELDCMYLD